jgi:hypothetical protein
VLTSSKLLLPSLDLLLSRECVCLEHRINKFCKLPTSCINVIDSAFVALDLCCCVVAVGFRLGRNGKLGHLLWRFIALDLLSRTLDVEHKRMVCGRDVEERVVSITGAAAVEAVEANIEAGGVVLGLLLVAEAPESSREGLTIESKHCVQSSRYTDCVGPGGRSSRRC